MMLYYCTMLSSIDDTTASHGPINNQKSKHKSLRVHFEG